MWPDVLIFSLICVLVTACFGFIAGIIAFISFSIYVYGRDE